MQKTLPKIHKIIPSFSFQSTHSYRIFLKNYPKNVHKLDLDSTTINSLEPDRQKKALRNLIKLTRKSRNIKALQDVNLCKYFKAKKSRAVLLMKKFHRVQSLGLLWDFYDASIQRETRRWLKYIKNLQSLRFQHIGLKTPPELSTIVESKKKNMKLLRDIRQRRIIRLVHSSSPLDKKGNYYPFDMRDYPSSLQEISLNLIQCEIDLDNVDKLFSMRKFQLLKKLELFCLELNMILVILKSIPNPQLLTSLGLFLKNNFPKSDEKHLVFIFHFIMNSCPGLEKLDLRITHPTEELQILNQQNKLKVLNLWISVKTEKHLQDIGFLLLTAKSLEVLDLTIDFDLNSKLNKEDFCEFYQVLSQLTLLKKLHLNFSPRQETHHIPPSYSFLMVSIACLSRLEELCLCIPDVESSLQANQLGKALEKVVHQLKRLEVDFYWQGLDSEESDEFIDVLGKMTKLRELSISQFSFSQEYSFSVFQKILKNCKYLEKVVLDQFEIPPGGEQILSDLMLSMLEKKGLKELRMKHVLQNNIRKGKTVIIFPDIVKKTPGLQFVKINSSNISYGWFHQPFEHFKYA